MDKKLKIGILIFHKNINYFYENINYFYENLFLLIL